MINWQQFVTQITGTAIIVAAIEHLRLHDHDRTEAQKRLYRFAKTIENGTFPLAENKREGFHRTMEELYWSKLQLNQIYFSDRADTILENFAEMDVCLRRPELAEATDSKIHTFLEDVAFEQAMELARLSRAATERIR